MKDKINSKINKIYYRKVMNDLYFKIGYCFTIKQLSALNLLLKVLS
jgi:hypothetical protein